MIKPKPSPAIASARTTQTSEPLGRNAIPASPAPSSAAPAAPMRAARGAAPEGTPPRRGRRQPRQPPHEQRRTRHTLHGAKGDQHPDVWRDRARERRDDEADAANERQASRLESP